MGISENVAYCRGAILHSLNKNVSVRGELLVGHIYEDNGYYRTYYLNGDLDTLARFICSCDKDKLICDSSDYAVLNSIGIYLDQQNLVESEYTELLDMVIAYQMKFEDAGVLPSFKTSDGKVIDFSD